MHFGNQLPFESVYRGLAFFVGHTSACLASGARPCALAISSTTGFSPPRNKPVAAAGGVSSASCPNGRQRSRRNLASAAWEPAKGELRSPDKLKHVPQRAARKLSAVSVQRSALERHEIVAACKEYGGMAIRKRPTSSRERSWPVTDFQPVARHSITVRRRSRPRPAEYSGSRGRNCRGRTSPSRRPGGRSCRDTSLARDRRLHPS